MAAAADGTRQPAGTDHPGQGHGGGHGRGPAGGQQPGHDQAGGHPSFLAHHFETPGQQFQAGKTGMWLFLSTELLFFSGLFCAYAVYRHNHPEIFVYAHQFLDKTLGGINTLVLILSSLTAAWAVRAAQSNQRRLLIGLITATLLCSGAFLGIKGIEYQHKWKHGLLWGARFNPVTEHLGIELPGAPDLPATVPSEPAGVSVAPGSAFPMSATGGAKAATAPAPSVPGKAGVPTAGATDPLQIHTNLKPAGTAPSGLAQHEPEGSTPIGHAPATRPSNVQIFFGIYFAMTGLHGVHVVAGIFAWLWVLRRAIRGDFSSAYFTPVDLTALYWHLVDLIWIYLFPLLYLIH